MKAKAYENTNTALYLKDGDNLIYLSYIHIPEIKYNPVPLLYIWGALPHCQRLLKINDGETFELYYSNCGDLAMTHENGILIHRFTDCQIVERRLKEPMAFDKPGILGVDLVLSCGIETPDWQVDR